MDGIIITRVYKNTNIELYTYECKPNARDYNLSCILVNAYELCSLGHESLYVDSIVVGLESYCLSTNQSHVLIIMNKVMFL